MKYAEYYDALRRAHNGELPLNIEQEQALNHTYHQPLWIIAGPGTGKTHTLIWLTFKRILVDGIQPDRIVLTTFTRKAAAELKSRMLLGRDKLVNVGVKAAEQIDISQILLGTLHGLCSRILQEQRYEPTLRIRLLEDELTQQFFVRRTYNSLLKCEDRSFWEYFGFLKAADPYLPNWAKRAEAACKLFNRLTENSIDAARLQASGNSHLQLLADAYQEYEQELQSKHYTDQAHLQAHFLAFLKTPDGHIWCKGNNPQQTGFTVIVDEYQDTNPIQETIYFQLAHTSRDLTVVGDDDQSLYRFRGATVESLIDFDRACKAYLGVTPAQITLHNNRRSHPGIVQWVNRYITYHKAMRDPDPYIRVRAPHKRPLIAHSGLNGAYPPVITIAEQANPAAARKVVQVVQELIRDRLISNYSQIALLSHSTRETSHFIGTFTKALRTAGIPLYNPRNGQAQKDRTFQAMIGALIEILDPDDRDPCHLTRHLQDYIQQCRDAYQALNAHARYPALAAYIQASIKAIRNAPFDPSQSYNYLTRSGGRRVTLSGLLYKLLAHEPFVSGMTDPEAGERLRVLNLILADFESLYHDGELRLETDSVGERQISDKDLRDFYTIFVEGMHDKLNDPEDDEISIQPGMLNVMTIHQSKGLEFEVVIVLRPDQSPWISDTHIAEDILDPYITRPTKPIRRRNKELRATEDLVRMFFVAYSRAKRLLIVAGSKIPEWQLTLGYNADGNEINSIAALRNEGVYLL